MYLADDVPWTIKYEFELQLLQKSYASLLLLPCDLFLRRDSPSAIYKRFCRRFYRRIYYLATGSPTVDFSRYQWNGCGSVSWPKIKFLKIRRVGHELSVKCKIMRPLGPKNLFCIFGHGFFALKRTDIKLAISRAF